MEYYIDPVTFVTQKRGFESRYIKHLLGLLDEGATIPFISRYRKEMTGSMDEVQVGQVREIYEQFKELEKRKKTVLENIEQQEKLTPELRKQIEHCKMCIRDRSINVRDWPFSVMIYEKITCSCR